MSKPKRKQRHVKAVLVGEVKGTDRLASALASLDAFRESVLPAGNARILFEDTGYHPTDLDEIEDALTHARIRPEQAGFWLLLRAHRAPLDPAQTERYAVEFITTPGRLHAVYRRYPCPTAVDVGRGVFGNKGGLLFVDDEDGRAVAYAPPELRDRRATMTQAKERRQRGLCPVCGARIRLVTNTTDGRYVGSCGDAFTLMQWRALGPRHSGSNHRKRRNE